MTTTAKNTLLDVLRNASGVIDYVFALPASDTTQSYIYGTIIWGAAASGKLSFSGAIDLENRGGSSVTITRIGLYNSSHVGVIGTPPDEYTVGQVAVDTYALASSITLAPGEIIRITAAEFTIAETV